MKKSHTQEKKCKKQVPQELLFEPPVFNFSNMQIIKNQNENSDDSNKNYLEQANKILHVNQSQQTDNFSAEQRESLKNAFRYICRLMFKQAHKYRQKIDQLAKQNNLIIENQQHFKRMFDKAEQISGERYFRKYVSNFEENERRTICEFMRWFLIGKYLRYISEEGKGKRKMMKKHLYIKFKNQVMLPYIESLI